MSRRRHNPVKPEMNMTPLIDVTFLLIVFFMLVNNIVASESVPLLPPKLEDPTTRDLGDVDKIVVSLVPLPFDGSDRADDPLNHPGAAQHLRMGLERFELDQLAAFTDRLRARRAEAPETSVLLRADAAAHYREVEPVMTAITNAGIGTVHLVAQMPQ